jgi:hypothetical protein
MDLMKITIVVDSALTRIDAPNPLTAPSVKDEKKCIGLIGNVYGIEEGMSSQQAVRFA